MNNSSGTLGGGDFYPVLPKLQKEARLRLRREREREEKDLSVNCDYSDNWSVWFSGTVIVGCGGDP
jgi:hypothetical protein